EQPAARAVNVQDGSPAGTPIARGDTSRGELAVQPSPLDKALESVNHSLEAWSTGMRFEMDEDAQRLVVSIIDSTTGEVLRTVPSDAVLRVARMIVQLQGSGVDTRA